MATSAGSQFGAKAGHDQGMTHPVIVVRQGGRKPLYVEIREPIDIGRECDGIIVADPQTSRRHATVSPRGASIVIEDLGSTNGTFLDGSRISSTVVLLGRSTVRMGDTTIQLAAAAGEDPARSSGPVGARGTVTVGDLGAVRATPSGVDSLRETSMESVARMVHTAPQKLAALQQDSGTITIVFSDIESSTERATAMGDAAWMKVLDEHNAIIRRHVASWDGTVVKNQGDGFMLTFGGARRALRAMIAVQQELCESGIAEAVRIRVGVHTGEVISDGEGDIFGKHVMIAARVGGVANGGEILVSSLVREIASARGDLHFGDARPVELKGIGGEHLVYPVEWRDFAPAS
ncbi:MAG: adenylate/guanylate cyclase domain-containing protein [Actinomycetota bacterium]|nr:adenylate/guanylate cyclase domain-containing protein [Actinomycetota bacterium]